jgi:LysR family positive regulator for ilvC
MTRIKDLEIFVEVADQSHFARASEKLHTSPASVSRALTRLEDALRATLLERDNRNVFLTPAGHQVYKFAKETLLGWRQLKQQFNHQGQLAGELSMFCTITAGYTLLSDVLLNFRRQHPQVDLRVINGDAAEAVTAVQKGVADISIAAKQSPWPDSLAFLSLQQVPLCLIYPIHQSPDNPWWQQPLILPDGGPVRKIIDKALAKHPEKSGIHSTVSGHEAVLALVALGFGVGIVPDLVVTSSGLDSKVHRVAAQEEFGCLDVGLCAKKSRLEDPLLRGFWETAQTLVQPLRSGDG